MANEGPQGTTQCRHWTTSLQVFATVTVVLVLVTLAVTLHCSHAGASDAAAAFADDTDDTDDDVSSECIVGFDRGLAVGARRQTFTGRSYCAYEGIPYVQPPLGPLRFEDPQPYHFEGARLFRNVSKACPQAWTMHMGMVETSEDCLYLNVYTGQVGGVGGAGAKPRTPGSAALRPVLLWIHGGSFVVGSSETDIFGPEFLLDKAVIVVTFNYRLAALGFVSIPDLGIGANLGLLDQLEALRWTAHHIAQFGGDPARVTLCGWSAGAASVTYHLYSPAAAGLFHGAIIMSGSMTQPWGYDYDPDRCGREYLRVCDATSKEQLQSRPLDQLMKGDSGLSIHFFALYYLCFMPSDDGNRAEAARRIVGRDPFERVRTERPVSDVPLLVGYTTLEHGNLHHERDFATTSHNFPNANGTVLRLLDDYLDRQAQAIAAANGTSERTFYRQLASVADIIYGIQYFIRHAATHLRSPLYRYLFAYEGAFGYAKNCYYRNQIARPTLAGPMHGDELGYLFTPYVYRRGHRAEAETPGCPRNPLTHYRAERRVQRQMVRLWTNFIKHGNPTPETDPEAEKATRQAIRWHPYNDPSSERGRRYLRIDRRLQLLPEADADNPYHQLWARVEGCLYEFECDFLSAAEAQPES